MKFPLALRSTVDRQAAHIRLLEETLAEMHGHVNEAMATKDDAITQMLGIAHHAAHREIAVERPGLLLGGS